MYFGQRIEYFMAFVNSMNPRYTSADTLLLASVRARIELSFTLHKA
jgi:hypothetical protein